MKLRHLRTIRVVVSLIFFLSALMVFMDYRGHIAGKSVNNILFFQFIPSLVKTISREGVVAFGFIIVLLLTLLFGRVYCSSVCPLGILQDIIGFFRRKLGSRKWLRYRRPSNWIRYSILAAVIIVFLSGQIILVNFLDPYSVFGRISTHLFKPVLVLGNNFLVLLMEALNNYSIKPHDLVAYSLVASIVSGLFLICIFWMVLSSGRLYCNTICPVGALLGLLSRISLFRISINETSCTSCKRCEKACKAECIDLEENKVDFSRCVACYNCFTACNQNGFSYSWRFRRKNKPDISVMENEPANTNRKAFLVFLLGGLFGARLVSAQYGERQRQGKGKGLGQGKGINRKNLEEVKNTAHIPVKKTYPVCPPGAQNLDHFNDACTACHLCVSQCPTQVLQPGFKEYGLKGFLQPYMDYHTSYCNYDCVVCSELCPTGAIIKLGAEEKHTVQIGKAKFIKNNCIVFTEKTDCGACSEHCPTKAVQMVDYKQNLFIPEVDESICIGCGACEYACPTTPYKAIYVDGNSIHQVADEPGKEEGADEVEMEEFPF